MIGLDRPPLWPGWHGASYPEDDTALLLDRSINLPDYVPAGIRTLDLLAGRELSQESIQLDDEIKRSMLTKVRRNPTGSSVTDQGEGLSRRVYCLKQSVCAAQPGMFKAVAAMYIQISRDGKRRFLTGDYMRTQCVNGALGSRVAAAEEASGRLDGSSG